MWKNLDFYGMRMRKMRFKGSKMKIKLKLRLKSQWLGYFQIKRVGNRGKKEWGKRDFWMRLGNKMMMTMRMIIMMMGLMMIWTMINSTSMVIIKQIRRDPSHCKVYLSNA